MKIEQTNDAVRRTGRYYSDLCWMTIPLLCMACYNYGPRPALLCLVAFFTGRACDAIAALLRRRPYVKGDMSNESFAMVIALLLPASVSWYVLLMAVLAGVLIGKEAFGGYGSYPFHPAAVGYAVAAVSWPDQVFRFPAPHTMVPLWDPSGLPLVNELSSTLKNGGLPITTMFDLLLGNVAGPMGATAALVVLSCGLFLLARRDIHTLMPLTFLLTCGLLVFLLPRQADLVGTLIAETVEPRLNAMRYELLSGANLFCCFFLMSEPYTCPRSRLGRIMYGVLLGVLNTGFRYYGVYETGICFALLLMGSLSAPLDRAVSRMIGWRREMAVIEKRKQGGARA